MPASWTTFLPLSQTSAKPLFEDVHLTWKTKSYHFPFVLSAILQERAVGLSMLPPWVMNRACPAVDVELDPAAGRARVVALGEDVPVGVAGREPGREHRRPGPPLLLALAAPWSCAGPAPRSARRLPCPRRCCRRAAPRSGPRTCPAAPGSSRSSPSRRPSLDAAFPLVEVSRLVVAAPDHAARPGGRQRRDRDDDGDDRRPRSSA